MFCEIRFGRGREESESEEDDEDNTLSNAIPSTSAADTIPDLFANISATTGHAAQEGFKGLVSVIDADKFRWMLIKWIVSMHIALSVIENKHFRELLVTIAPALEQFMGAFWDKDSKVDYEGIRSTAAND